MPINKDKIKIKSNQLKSACREPDLSLSGLDPVPLSKIGTRLLASLGSKGKNRNSLVCLRNAGSHSAVTYCTRSIMLTRASPETAHFGGDYGGYIETQTYTVLPRIMNRVNRNRSLKLAQFPVSLSKIGTRLLASLGSKGKNRNSLACLRNAGSHSAVTYCKSSTLDFTVT